MNSVRFVLCKPMQTHYGHGHYTGMTQHDLPRGKGYLETPHGSYSAVWYRGTPVVACSYIAKKENASHDSIIGYKGVTSNGRFDKCGAIYYGDGSLYKGSFNKNGFIYGVLCKRYGDIYTTHHGSFIGNIHGFALTDGIITCYKNVQSITTGYAALKRMIITNGDAQPMDGYREFSDFKPPSIDDLTHYYTIDGLVEDNYEFLIGG